MKKTIIISIVALVIIVGSLYATEKLGFRREKTYTSHYTTPEDINSVADFSLATFFMLANKEENLLISPHGIYSAFLMAYVGSSGGTKTEMANVLGISEEDIKEIYLNTRKQLEKSSEEGGVSIANAFFLREDLLLKEKFEEDILEYFDVQVEDLPLTGAPINQWAREKTNGKIDNIISDGPIDREEIGWLILNAVHFRAPWSMQFEESSTQEREFRGYNKTIDVDMMSNQGYYECIIENDLKMVILKYESISENDYAFYAIMPKKNLIDFYREFSSEYFKELKQVVQREEIILRLPKFSFESDLELDQALIDMGMKRAFSEVQADFENMIDFEKIDPSIPNVWISLALHKTFIEVDENGTEAAAVTTLFGSAPVGIMEMEPRKPRILEFNKPFFFIIEEAKTGTILFLGQVLDPLGS